MSEKVWVEVNILGFATRIFASRLDAILRGPADAIFEVERADAVKQIRDKIWENQEGLCIRCSAIITKATMHMHEREFRGRGGEISLVNSIGLCYTCHLGQRGVHPGRQLNFTKSTEKL